MSLAPPSPHTQPQAHLSFFYSRVQLPDDVWLGVSSHKEHLHKGSLGFPQTWLSSSSPCGCKWHHLVASAQMFWTILWLLCIFRCCFLSVTVQFSKIHRSSVLNLIGFDTCIHLYNQHFSQNGVFPSPQKFPSLYIVWFFKCQTNCAFLE